MLYVLGRTLSYIKICLSLYFDIFTRIERLMFPMKDITQLI